MCSRSACSCACPDACGWTCRYRSRCACVTRAGGRVCCGNRFFQPHAIVMPSWQSRALVQRAPGTAAAHCGVRVLAVYPVIMHSLMLTQ